MIIQISRWIVICFFVAACNSGPIDDPIPIVPFNDIVINLNFPDYTSLSRDGGYKEIANQNAGVRGIILYRSSSTLYIAYERNCSYHPNEACATVDVHSSGLFMIDSCCGSTFNFSDGTPTGGPAWRPLRKYRTQLNGNILTITDEIVD